MGRIGKMFAMEHWEVEPDMMTVAERLAAGMPLSAVVGKTEIMDSVHPGGLGGTYGANPVAHAVIDIFEEEVLLNTSEKPGARLAERFAQWQGKMDIVNEVRGKGAMVGLTLVKKDGSPAAEEPGKVVAYCRQKGLLLLTCSFHGNVIRALVPLVVENDLLEKVCK